VEHFVPVVAAVAVAPAAAVLEGLVDKDSLRISFDYPGFVGVLPMQVDVAG